MTALLKPTHVPPFHAEHIGSLLRPDVLIEKRNEHATDKCSDEELRAVEDVAIKDVVDMQLKAGIKGVTDGEFRRYAFYDGVFANLDGMTRIAQYPLSEMEVYVPHISQILESGVNALPSYYCSGKIKRRQGFYTSDFKYLKSILQPDQVGNAKVTLAPPEWMHLCHGDKTYDKTIYKNDSEYFADLAQAYREEIQELYDLGCRHIQLDEPAFCYFINDDMIKGLKAQGRDPSAVITQYIQLLNDCLRDKPADMNAGIHMCRGNYKGMHFSEGGYERIAKRLFIELNVNCFYMEYDNIRSGSFEPLQFLPKDKIVVLGLVTTKVGRLEDKSEVKKRIYEAAEWICKGDPTRSKEEALAQLRLSTQCGFASTIEGNPVTQEDQRKKLELLASIASEVWGSELSK